MMKYQNYPLARRINELSSILDTGYGLDSCHPSIVKTKAFILLTKKNVVILFFCSYFPSYFYIIFLEYGNL